MRKVRSGDPLVIPAASFNAFVDATWNFQRRQRGIKREAQREFRQAGIVLVRNDSGADYDRFNILGISGPLILPTENADEFAAHVALSGVTPDADHMGAFVVLLEPIPNGEIGRAAIDGVCVVRVEMLDEDHRFADVKPNYADVLQSATSGSAQLLWIQPEAQRDDPAIAWVVARIGLPQTTHAIARLAAFVYDAGTPPKAVAFVGFPVSAIAQANPDPMPAELTTYWPLAWPYFIPNGDLQWVLPGIPFADSLAPGAPDANDGHSEVFVIEVPDARVPIEEGGTRWFILSPAFQGIC